MVFARYILVTLEPDSLMAPDIATKFPTGNQTMNIYDLQMESITGEKISFSDFKDQALLIVNLASQWGLTSQYAGLRALHESGKVTVLGFPCNQFGAQEPGTNQELFDFATRKYQANFPMFNKIEVNGDNAAELYQGKPVKRFHPKVTPQEIEAALADLI